MVAGERLRITLTGGAPWGFRLQGGGNFPLEVAKIRKRSSAAEAGLHEGDHVVGINDYPLSGRSHQSAMDIVDMATSKLDFEVVRSGSKPTAFDPQRQQRAVAEQPGQGQVSSAQSQFTTQNGNVRTQVQTNEYAMTVPGGTRITKTVTQQSQFTSQSGALSPIPAGGHMSRSPRRSPVMWSPGSKSASPASASAKSPLMWQPPSHHSSERSPDPPRQKSKSPMVWKPKSYSPIPAHVARSRSSSTQGKENADPTMVSEQAKWEARHQHELETTNIAASYLNKQNENKAPKMFDPKYPMFEIPKPEWHPQPKIIEPIPEEQKKPPPVAPKPTKPEFDATEQDVAGVDRHYPGMIRPPMQPIVAPAPIPPPMPGAPGAPFVPMFKPRKFVAGEDMIEEAYHDHPQHPHHLPIFGPPVMFAHDEDSGLPLSPDRSDQISDISSIGKARNDNNVNDDDVTESSEEKLFSDSAFYDDSTHRFPTIDEQMTMCKKIAESLTSVANKRARGARMFANRKRKANKWVHEHCLEFGVCECSSTGDVADLDELDSELYYDEGGSKPLFTFRIPNLAGQITEGERMSLSKQEFERLRLVAPKTDHNAVSPNQCFNIAADLHRGGKNKGAKLFQRRQARVEKYVIDETNVNRPPPNPTKLEQFIQAQPPQKTPWNAAAGGDVHRAFDRQQQQQGYATMPTPRHNLTTENTPKLIEGSNFNLRARGWGGAGPGSHQHSVYRESAPTSNYQKWTEEQTSSTVMTDSQGTSTKFGDYNRRMKAWGGSGQPVQQTQSVQSYSEQTNYNSLPRGFGASGAPRSSFEPQSQVGYCDL